MVAVADTRRSVEQGRVPDGMLAAFHRIAAGYVGMVLSLPYTTVSSPTRALPYTQAGVKPAPWECHCCRPLSLGRRWRRVLCLAFVAGGQEARESQLMLVAVTWASLSLSRRTAFLGLAGDLGYEFKGCLFGVVILAHGGFPFRGVFAGLRSPIIAVRAGELGFLDWGASSLGFRRGLPMTITKVDSKVRSLDSPV